MEEKIRKVGGNESLGILHKIKDVRDSEVSKGQ